jgi:hypothetical protein
MVQYCGLGFYYLLYNILGVHVGAVYGDPREQYAVDQRVDLLCEFPDHLYDPWGY